MFCPTFFHLNHFKSTRLRHSTTQSLAACCRCVRLRSNSPLLLRACLRKRVVVKSVEQHGMISIHPQGRERGKWGFWVLGNQHHHPLDWYLESTVQTCKARLDGIWFRACVVQQQQRSSSKACNVCNLCCWPIGPPAGVGELLAHVHIADRERCTDAPFPPPSTLRGLDVRACVKNRSKHWNKRKACDRQGRQGRQGRQIDVIVYRERLWRYSYVSIKFIWCNIFNAVALKEEKHEN